jgi:hypothetical protein
MLTTTEKFVLSMSVRAAVINSRFHLRLRFRDVDIEFMVLLA